MRMERMSMWRRHPTAYTVPTGRPGYWAGVAGVSTHLPWRSGSFNLASQWDSKQGGWQAQVGIARGH